MIVLRQRPMGHISALRFDQVSAPILGMSKVISEDSARREVMCPFEGRFPWPAN